MLGNIYEAKPRYELLDELLEDYIENIQFTNNVNVIIDLKQVYRKIFRSSYVLDSLENSYLAMEAQRIASDIINIIGHYRNYFYKRNKYSTFYFLYSDNECDVLKEINKDYKKDYYEKYMNSEEYKDKIILLKKTTNALKTIINMLPNCFFINTTEFDEYIFTKYIINLNKTNELNVVLSNDENMFQLVNNNTVCLTISGLDTKCVNTKNLFEFFDINTKINSGLFPYVLAISGNKKYSIPGVKGYSFKKSVQFIEYLVENKLIQNTRYETFELKREFVNEDIKIQKNILEHFDIIKNNYEIFSLNKLYFENVALLGKYFNKVHKIYSINELKSINNSIFTNYPLDLQKILKGELS